VYVCDVLIFFFLPTGFKLDETQIAQLRLERVYIKARVRIFWNVKTQKMKIAILKHPPPRIVELTHELRCVALHVEYAER